MPNDTPFFGANNDVYWCGDAYKLRRMEMCEHCQEQYPYGTTCPCHSGKCDECGAACDADDELCDRCNRARVLIDNNEQD